MTEPYYQDDLVTLYHGDSLDYFADKENWGDAIITDPPYGETALSWDSWPANWPTRLAKVAPAMWCFGSFRMFMERRDDFRSWKFSHEIVWRKNVGSGFTTDKFRRVHELATFWYQGEWRSIRHEVPRVPAMDGFKGSVHRGKAGAHTGRINDITWTDDGTRLTTTVIDVNNTKGYAVHPTQKPVGIVSPLIEYSVHPRGTVVDPFAGSGTTLLAAKLLGRKSVGVEADEGYCEAAALRLSQGSFDLEGIA